MRVLVLFGGRSGEHEVSVTSARSVVTALDALGHDVTGVGISRRGCWVRCDPRDVRTVPDAGEPYAITPGPVPPADVDVVFPVLHGPFGEDGSIQGLLELSGVAYVGAGVEGSVVGVNKVLQKRLLAQADVPLVDYVAFDDRGWTSRRDELVGSIAGLGFPCFSKPARLGSSVGISKIGSADAIPEAVERALHHDELVLVEAFGGPRELEVAALEDADGNVEFTPAGEVVPAGDFYDYAAKYDDDATELRIPAPVPDAVQARIRDLAARVFRLVSCEGLARIDFFYDPDGDRLVLNEVNTIPGITPVSMYPRLWEGAGRPFPTVVQTLLDHAIARGERRRRLEAERSAHHDEEVSRTR